MYLNSHVTKQAEARHRRHPRTSHLELSSAHLSLRTLSKHGDSKRLSNTQHGNDNRPSTASNCSGRIPHHINRRLAILCHFANSASVRSKHNDRVQRRSGELLCAQKQYFQFVFCQDRMVVVNMCLFGTSLYTDVFCY